MMLYYDALLRCSTMTQAEDRCHRLGQKKAVTVIRLITKGTVDEDIHAIAQRKLRLDAAVLEGLGEGALVREGTGGARGGKPGGEAQTMGVILKAIIAGRSLAPEDAKDAGDVLGVLAPTGGVPAVAVAACAGQQGLAGAEAEEVIVLE